MAGRLVRAAAVTFVAVAVACGGGGTSDAPAPVPVSSVSVEPATVELDLELAPTAQLTATVAPANATDQRVLWRSSDNRVANVSEAGPVTGVQGGSAVVTATTVDGGKAALAVVRVAAPIVWVTGVTLNKASTSLAVGASEQLVANVLPTTAAEKRVAWSTSNDRIVWVTAAGKIVGVGAGTATVTVTTVDGEKTARCEVTVTSTAVAVTGVTLDQTTLSLPIGSAGTLRPPSRPPTPRPRR